MADCNLPNNLTTILDSLQADVQTALIWIANEEKARSEASKTRKAVGITLLVFVAFIGCISTILLVMELNKSKSKRTSRPNIGLSERV